MRRLAILFLFAGLLLQGPAMADPAASKSGVYDALNLFDQAFERVRRDAVEEVSGDRLVRAAIAGMLSSLDPNAGYFDKAALSEKGAAADTVGLVVTQRHGAVQVVAPRDGSPAAAAGIEPGDIILTIGREPAEAMNLPAVQEGLQGSPGSLLKLRLERRGIDHALQVTVRRAKFQLTPIDARLSGNVGYIRIAGFDAATPAALAAAIGQLRQKSGGKLIGLVLDLRNNPGGEFQAAVAVADAFLDKGVIALVRSPASPPKSIRASGGDLAAGLPIVALINGGTAAEAELVAAALKGNHRAVLVGSRSFGESAIESMIPLGEDGAIRLATARFLTPAGDTISGTGIAPDIEVRPVKLVKLQTGLGIREADLPGALKNPNLEGGQGTAPPAASAPASAPLVKTGDEALLRATDILRSLAITKSPDPS